MTKEKNNKVGNTVCTQPSLLQCVNKGQDTEELYIMYYVLYVYNTMYCIHTYQIRAYVCICVYVCTQFAVCMYSLCVHGISPGMVVSSNS